MKTSTLLLAALAPVILPAGAVAQKLGTYAGTATIHATEVSGKSRREYTGKVTINVPVTSTGGSTMAEVDDVDKPSATATITEFTSSKEETSKGADGKYATLSCKLARPTEIPLNSQGSITIDTRAKTYTVFIAMVGLKQIPLDCVHSQSGAHKRQEGIGLSIATHDPSSTPKALAYTDPARLAAKHKLTINGSGGATTTLEQEWDFQLRR